MIATHLKSEIDPVPNEFQCPISLEIMKEPVLAPCCHSFEQHVIVNWPQTHHVCPLCREKLESNQLVVNRPLKNLIEKFIADGDLIQKLKEKIAKIESASFPREYLELAINQLKSDSEVIFNSMKHEKELEIHSLKLKIRQLEEQQKFPCHLINVKEDKSDQICTSLAPGLNLQSRCANSLCSIYKKNTWINKGIGKFNLNTEYYTTSCPACDQLFEGIEKFALFNCLYSIQAKKSCGEKVEKAEQKLPADFSLLIDKIDHFLYMNIVTKIAN